MTPVATSIAMTTTTKMMLFRLDMVDSLPRRLGNIGTPPSFGALYFEAHRVGPAGVRDDELVLPVLRRRDLNRTLRSGRVVLSDFRAGGVGDEKVHVGILQAVRGSLELFPRRERQEVSDLSLVLHLDLPAIERRPLAQVGRLDVLRGIQGGN